MILGAVSPHELDEVAEGGIDEAGERETLLPVTVVVLLCAVLVVQRQPEKAVGGDEIEAALAAGALAQGAALEERSLAAILHCCERLNHVCFASPLERSQMAMPSFLATSKMRSSR